MLGCLWVLLALNVGGNTLFVLLLLPICGDQSIFWSSIFSEIFCVCVRLDVHVSYALLMIGRSVVLRSSIRGNCREIKALFGFKYVALWCGIVWQGIFYIHSRGVNINSTIAESCGYLQRITQMTCYYVIGWRKCIGLCYKLQGRITTNKNPLQRRRGQTSDPFRMREKGENIEQSRRKYAFC